MSNRLECSPRFLSGSCTRDHLKAFCDLKHVTDVDLVPHRAHSPRLNFPKVSNCLMAAESCRLMVILSDFCLAYHVRSQCSTQSVLSSLIPKSPHSTMTTQLTHLQPPTKSQTPRDLHPERHLLHSHRVRIHGPHSAPPLPRHRRHFRCGTFLLVRPRHRR